LPAKTVTIPSVNCFKNQLVRQIIYNSNAELKTPTILNIQLTLITWTQSIPKCDL